MFRLLAPPNIVGVLVIKISIFILLPTLMIIFTLFLIPSGLLVSLLVQRLQKSTLAVWVGWDKSVACPEADCLIDN